jgi:tetratricopeptide (TPR) repeat protein
MPSTATLSSSYVDKVARNAVYQLYRARKTDTPPPRDIARPPIDEGFEPSLLPLFGGLAELRIAGGPYEKLELMIRSMLDRTPHSSKSWRKYGWYFLEHVQDETTEARVKTRDAFATALAYNPADWLNYRDLGEIYLINRDHEKAYVCFHEASRLNPRNPEPLARLSLAAVRLRRIDEARRLVDRVQRMASESRRPVKHMTFDSAGMTLLLLGEFDGAEFLIRRALELAPGHGYYLSHLKMLERERKDSESRENRGKRYTPLYLRQGGTLRYFDERDLPLKEETVATWLREAVAALTSQQPIPLCPFDPAKRPSSPCLDLIWSIKREFHDGKPFGELLRTLCASSQLDWYWEAFIQLLFEVFNRKEELYPLLHAARRFPFGDPLDALSSAFLIRGDLSLAAAIGARSPTERHEHVIERRASISTRYSRSYGVSFIRFTRV